jgi:hypothetical protein
LPPVLPVPSSSEVWCWSAGSRTWSTPGLKEKAAACSGRCSSGSSTSLPVSPAAAAGQRCLRAHPGPGLLHRDRGRAGAGVLPLAAAAAGIGMVPGRRNHLIIVVDSDLHGLAIEFTVGGRNARRSQPVVQRRCADHAPDADATAQTGDCSLRWKGSTQPVAATAANSFHSPSGSGHDPASRESG